VSDCYQSAWNEITGYGGCSGRAAYLAALLQVEPLLAHGIATLTGGPHEGERFLHAWAEVGAFVIDHGKVIPLAVYYSVGKIDGSDIVYYTRAEALAHALEHETYGPWTAVPAGVLFNNADEEMLDDEN
jgi:hypothetical protein